MYNIKYANQGLNVGDFVCRSMLNRVLFFSACKWEIAPTAMIILSLKGALLSGSCCKPLSVEDLDQQFTQVDFHNR